MAMDVYRQGTERRTVQIDLEVCMGADTDTYNKFYSGAAVCQVLRVR